MHDMDQIYTMIIILLFTILFYIILYYVILDSIRFDYMIIRLDNSIYYYIIAY